MQDLNVDFNENQTGHRLTGNLEQLVKKGFFSRLSDKISKTIFKY